MKKKLFALLLALALCVSLAALPALAAEAEDADVVNAVEDSNEVLAESLRTLDLFLGVGDRVDGTANFDLGRAPTRAEALTMLVRALGRGAEAESMGRTHPFTDVPAWADGYVSYACENGLTKGGAETTFDPDSPASPQMYLTLMLRALGYTDGDNGDFLWDYPWARAAACGILPMAVDEANFLLADVVKVTAAALFADCKDGSGTLADRLIADGVMTEEQFSSVFPEDPFAMDAKLGQAVAEAIAAYRPALESRNEYPTRAFILLDTVEDNGLIAVSALAAVGSAELMPDNTIGSNGAGICPWCVWVDPVTFEVKDCITSAELDYAGREQSEVFSQTTLDAWNVLHMERGLTNICLEQAVKALRDGTWRYRPTAYETALAQVKAELVSELKILEEDNWPCTVVSGCIATPHGAVARLCLVYKDGFAPGAESVIYLPLLQENLMGMTSLPLETVVSEDGQTLTYTYHFDEPLMGENGVLCEAGDFTYRTTLATGETEETILPVQ